ncbi:hypothetical protein [Saccharopolyspora sp. NPDC002686]|uniref:hypothetical protein n=1 Tax=Saccharopolyspora sp. NPDC002686 TaxID=3154541 RepID=UPI00332DFE7B
MDCPGPRRDEASAELVRAIKDGVGISTEVAVVDPDTLERSVGKLRRIVDRRES